MREVTLCYAWSRMGVTDEVVKFDKVDGATFVDFIEALGRVADYMSLPEPKQLTKARRLRQCVESPVKFTKYLT